MDRCPWKIRYAPGQDVHCGKEDHITGRRAHNAEGREVEIASPDPEHEALLPNGITRLHWFSMDRREFTGDWPGPCLKLGTGHGHCILHVGHHGRCAP